MFLIIDEVKKVRETVLIGVFWFADKQKAKLGIAECHWSIEASKCSKCHAINNDDLKFIQEYLRS